MFTAKTRLQQREEREHASSLPALNSIRIIALQIGSCVFVAGENLRDPGGATLRDDVRREIDFVKRRANARADLRGHACGLGSEMRAHFFDCCRNYAERGSVFAGMRQ